jgi:hypothetical protein
MRSPGLHLAGGWRRCCSGPSTPPRASRTSPTGGPRPNPSTSLPERAPSFGWRASTHTSVSHTSVHRWNRLDVLSLTMLVAVIPLRLLALQAHPPRSREWPVVCARPAAVRARPSPAAVRVPRGARRGDERAGAALLGRCCNATPSPPLTSMPPSTSLHTPAFTPGAAFAAPRGGRSRGRRHGRGCGPRARRGGRLGAGRVGRRWAIPARRRRLRRGPRPERRGRARRVSHLTRTRALSSQSERLP